MNLSLGVWPTRRCHGQRQRRRAQTSSGVSPTPPNTRHGIRRPSTNSIESPPEFVAIRAVQQKRPQRAAFIRLIFIGKSGAGEGIRTLDPNLGNVFRRFTPEHLCLSRRPLNHYCIRLSIATCLLHRISFIAADFPSVLPPCFPGLRRAIRGSRIGTIAELWSRSRLWQRL